MRQWPASFPLAAPLAPHFVTSASRAEQRRWIEAGTRISGASQDEFGRRVLTAPLRTDCFATTEPESSRRFRTMLSSEHGVAADPDLPEMFRAVIDRGIDPGLTAPVEQLSRVASVHVPVRDSTGEVILCLDLLGFDGTESRDEVVRCRDRLILAGQRATLALDSPLPF